jgi:hypothetical protein
VRQWRRGQHELVAAVGRTGVRQGVQVPQLADRHAEHGQQRVVHEDLGHPALVGTGGPADLPVGQRARRPDLERRVVGGDRAHLQLPQVVDEGGGGAQAGGGGHRRVLRPTGRVERLVPRHPAGPDQQDVAAANGDPGLLEGAGDVLDLDRIGLRHLQRPPGPLAEPCHVGQHAAADDAGPAPVPHAVLGVGQPAVEAELRMVDVPEAVPLAGGLGVEVRQDLIVAVAEVGDLLVQRRPAEERRVEQPQIGVEPEHHAGADQPGRPDHARGVEHAQQAEPRVDAGQ